MTDEEVKAQEPEKEPEKQEPESEKTDKDLSKKERKKLQKQAEEAEKKQKEAEAQLLKSQTEAKEANDKFMRLYAEFDNYKKRSSKEAEGIYTNAYADAVKELLPVFDNIERAAEYAADEASKNGLLLITSNFREVLKKMGVEAFGEVGEEFNANLHNAVMHVENEALGENVIAAVFQKGYKKGDKVIRYATVQVAN